MFDPVTSHWSETAPIGIARWRHTATLLDTYRAAIIGGGVATTEIYDPYHDRWHDGPAIEVTGNHTVNVLGDGSLMFISDAGALRSFAGVTGFLPATPMNSAREGHFAVSLTPDTILVVGGVTHSGTYPGAEIYEAAADAWFPTVTPMLSRHVWSNGASSAAVSRGRAILHADNVGFLMYDRTLTVHW
jgi:hypothetical protein